MKNKNKRYVVYKHTSPNGKCYIGITRQSPPEKRWGYKGNGYCDNEHFSRAISKYSWENIKHEILFTNLTKEEAEQKEIELIAFYDSMNPDKGYNMTPGGNYNVNVILKPVKQYTADGVFIQEYECIKYGAIATNINKSAISLCCNNKAKLAGGYIWQFSDVELTKEHISWCNSDKRSENRISVSQYLKNGNFVKEYESLTAASIETGIDLCIIVMACKGEYRTAGNYIWRYANEELTEEHLAWCNMLSSDSLKKKVNQYLRDGTFICTYDSIEEAHLKTGINRNCIAVCCRGEGKTAGNYLWRFSNEDITQEYIEWCNKIESSEESRKRAEVIQYTMDGMFIAIYKSLTEAGKATGISRKSISAVCKDKKEQAGGFIWRYASDIQDPAVPLFPTASTPSSSLSESV